MMRSGFGVCLLLLLGLGAGAGCSSDEVDKGDAADLCGTYCARFVECDATQSQAACQVSCQSEYDADKLGSTYSSQASTCLKNEACASFTAGTALVKCNDLAVAASTPSAAGTAFCSNLATKLTSCTLTSISATECSGRIKKYNDAAINLAAGCLESACETVVSCVNGAIPGTDCTLTCVDAASARYCDDTGALTTVNCAEVFAEDGLISNGCTTDTAGAGCTLDGLADPECEAGTPAFAYCAQLPEENLVDVYVGCFNDMNGAHTVIPCYADFIAPMGTMPPVDCVAADAACLPAM